MSKYGVNVKQKKSKKCDALQNRIGMCIKRHRFVQKTKFPRDSFQFLSILMKLCFTASIG